MSKHYFESLLSLDTRTTLLSGSRGARTNRIRRRLGFSWILRGKWNPSRPAAPMASRQWGSRVRKESGYLSSLKLVFKIGLDRRTSNVWLRLDDCAGVDRSGTGAVLKIGTDVLPEDTLLLVRICFSSILALLLVYNRNGTEPKLGAAQP